MFRVGVYNISMFLQELDVLVFNFINHLPHNVYLDEFSKILHLLTREGILYFMIGLVLFLTRKRVNILFVRISILSGVLTFFFNDVFLKNMFMRQRPPNVLTDVILVPSIPSSLSFPSGQAAVAFCVATMVHNVYPKSNVSYVAWGFALIIGLDRIYMGHHFPLDVLVGAALGTIISILMYKYRIMFGFPANFRTNK